MAKEPVWWCGPLGGFDDFGDAYDLKPGGEMFDAKTKQGPWGNMTRRSWEKHGVGRLGLGWGQRYEMQPNGRYLKVEG